MEKACLVCETVFEGRADAKTCSDKCRQIFRRISVTEVADRIVTDGQKVSQIKGGELSVTTLPAVDLDTPCDTGTIRGVPGEVHLDIGKDLHLNLEKDLGITAWTADGIFIRPDIRIGQVQNIARLIHAKHGRPCPEFRQQGL